MGIVTIVKLVVDGNVKSWPTPKNRALLHHLHSRYVVNVTKRNHRLNFINYKHQKAASPLPVKNALLLRLRRSISLDNTVISVFVIGLGLILNNMNPC
jgi:hypothetical protein